MVDQILPLGKPDVARYALALGGALRQIGADVSTSIAESRMLRLGARRILHVGQADVPTVTSDVAIVHDFQASLVERGSPLFAATVATLHDLSKRGIPARLLPEVVDPGAWAGIRISENPFDDGRFTILSIAPLGIGEAQNLIEMFVALERVIGNARLLIETADCDSGALEMLERDRRELELHQGLILLDGDRKTRYAAYRAASIACSFGRPLPNVSRAVEALWFDLPVVAFDDAISREVLEPCSFLIDTRVPREIATILKVVAGDSGLRAAAIAEGRRIRERYAPATVSSIVLDALAVRQETSAVRLP